MSRERVNKDSVIIVMDSGTKDVFSEIGLTLYAAQAFEESLIGMLLGSYVIQSGQEWRTRYKEEVANLTSMTLGKLLKRVKELASLEKESELLLQQALEQRNRFIHKFYNETFGLITDVKGREWLIREAVQLRTIFREAEKLIEPISYDLMLKAGMSDQQIEEYTKSIVEQQIEVIS